MPTWRKNVSIIALYGITAILLLWSWRCDKKKSVAALKKGWKAFENLLPQFLPIILLIGLGLAVLEPSIISRILGKESGLTGMALAAVLGSIILMPGFIAFPLAATP
ncbi:MAG: hypothetical protein K6F46_12490 [Desulfovibrio sp.]|nr:hypothetical protein [Desulfovibrio sp.]